MKFILIAFTLITFVNGRKTVKIEEDPLSGIKYVDNPQTNTRRFNIPINVHLSTASDGNMGIFNKVTSDTNIENYSKLPSSSPVTEIINSRRFDNPVLSGSDENEFVAKSQTNTNSPLSYINLLAERSNSGRQSPETKENALFYNSNNKKYPLTRSFGEMAYNPYKKPEELEYPATSQTNTDSPLSYFNLLGERSNSERQSSETNENPLFYNSYNKKSPLRGTFEEIAYNPYKKPAEPIDENNNAPSSNKHNNIPNVFPMTAFHRYPYKMKDWRAIPHIKSSNEKDYNDDFDSQHKNQHKFSNGPINYFNLNQAQADYDSLPDRLNINDVNTRRFDTPPSYFENSEMVESPANTNNQYSHADLQKQTPSRGSVPPIVESTPGFNIVHINLKNKPADFINTHMNYQRNPHLIPNTGNEEKENFQQFSGHVSMEKKFKSDGWKQLDKSNYYIEHNNPSIKNTWSISRSPPNRFVPQNFKSDRGKELDKSNYNIEHNDSSRRNSGPIYPTVRTDTNDKPYLGFGSQEGEKIRVHSMHTHHQANSNGNNFFHKHNGPYYLTEPTNKDYSQQHISKTNPHLYNIPPNGKGISDGSYNRPAFNHKTYSIPHEKYIKNMHGNGIKQENIISNLDSTRHPSTGDSESLVDAGFNMPQDTMQTNNQNM